MYVLEDLFLKSRRLKNTKFFYMESIFCSYKIGGIIHSTFHIRILLTKVQA